MMDLLIASVLLIAGILFVFGLVAASKALSDNKKFDSDKPMKSRQYESAKYTAHDNTWGPPIWESTTRISPVIVEKKKKKKKTFKTEKDHIDHLQTELELAIRDENYEEAAKLRDAINKLKTK